MKTNPIYDQDAQVIQFKVEDKDEQRFEPILRKITQKYSMDKLMMMLDKKKLEALEEEFSAHPDGIKLGNFVWLMKASIKHAEDEKYDLVYGLQRLFAEIDINGDEHMEWTEFTQYIIDAVIQNPSMQGTGGKSKDLLQETKMLKFRKFYPSKFKDKTSHNNWIKNVVWCPKFQALMVIENNQKSIKMINTQDLTTKFSINLPPQKKEVFIIDVDYSNEHQTFGCIDSDCNMLFWDFYISLKLSKTLKSPCLQLKLKYLKNHKTWITIGTDHVIREYDLRKTGEPLILSLDGHKDVIFDVIELTNPFSIASASLDTTIRIYSLVDKEDISVLREHEKGVRQLSYNSNFGGFIISVGFERNIYVWSPEVTQKKSLIGKLEGHTEIVVCAKFMNSKPFCVSIDEKYNFRFWDVRTLTCVQVIANETNSQVPVYGLFVYPSMAGQEKFIVQSKRLLFYETKKKEPIVQQQNQQTQQQQSGKSLNDQVNPLIAEFNYYYLNFSIVTPQDIRIYNAKDGKLLKIIQNIVDPRTKAPITSFCMDDRQRKFYVGDSAGAIRTFNISNGVAIKTVQKPFSKYASKPFDQINDMDSHEISSLSFLHLENHSIQLLVSTSWDSSLQIFDEEQPDESHLLRVSVGGHGREDISCLAVSQDLALIATGSCSGIIAIWDFESNKVENYCMEHSKSITSLFFLYPLPILVSTCNGGYVCFWGMKQAPLDYRYKLLKKIKNSSLSCDNVFSKNSISSSKTKFLKSDLSFTSALMILGDEEGFLYKWDLSPVIKEFRLMGFRDIQSVSKYQVSFNPKKNAQINALSNSKTMLYFAEVNQKKVQAESSENYVKKLQWQGHQSKINSITYLENPDGIITCSTDRHVKLWSLEGELWGDINLLRENYDKQWSYPFDWSEKKVKEIEKVQKLMAVVEPEYTKEGEQVVFDQLQQKQKNPRELIDYLQKRNRRHDLEENQRRQHERQIMLQNQEQMRAQYVSQQMKYSENVYMDKFLQEVQRMSEDNYQGYLKNGLIQGMDQRFDSLIQASLQGQDIKTLLKQIEDGTYDINQFKEQNQNIARRTIKLRKSESSNLNLHQLQSQRKKIQINYPKPIKNRKDMNKQFNETMFNKTNSQMFSPQQSQLTLLSEPATSPKILASPSTDQKSAQRVGFSSTNYQTFNFYDPPKDIKSTALQYEQRLQPFSPQRKESIPVNLKTSIQNLKQSVSSQGMHRNSSAGTMGQVETRPYTSMQMSSQKSSQMNQRLSTANMSKEERLLLNTNKLAHSQRNQSLKIAHLANQMANFTSKLEYQMKRETLQTQQSIDQASGSKQTPLFQDLKSPSSQIKPGTAVAALQKNRSHQQLNTLMSPKQRRCIIGFEAGGHNANQKFLKKLNNFISHSGQPKSQQSSIFLMYDFFRISDQVSNMRYSRGEGFRLLRINYNNVQFENKVLHTEEFGYKHKDPEPELKNIFDEDYILEI